MKKLLLTTACAALISASVVAPSSANANDGLSLGIGGWFAGYAAFNNQDTPAGTDLRGFDLRKETRVNFKGETTLDNGLTVGAFIEMNMDRANGGATTNESYIYFSNDLGRLNFGEEDGAAKLLQIAAPAADKKIDGVRQHINTFDLSQLAGANIGLTADRLDYDHAVSGKANKLTYFTPVFHGMQFGLTYVPAVSEADQGNLAAITTNNDANDYDDGYEVALRYERQMDAFDLYLGAGWSSFARENANATQDDRETLNAAIKVGFDNIKVGVSYLEDNNGVANNGDTDIFVVGASYKMDAYTFGVSYYDRSDEENAGTHGVAGDIDTKRWTLGAAYKYGPGMSFNAAVSHVESETSVTGDEERSGYQFTLGTNINF